jgi:ABC-type transporter Mla subunit MlaD
MDDALAQRVDALERAITDGDADLEELTAEAEALDRLEEAETAIEDIEQRVRELEAATQALRGYVGNIRSVNQDVEQRAEAALSKAEAVETALREQDGGSPAKADAATGPADDLGPTPPANAGAETTPSQTAAQPPSAGPGVSTPGPDRREPTASADGGTTAQPRTHGSADRCHACGRAHATSGSERCSSESASATPPETAAGGTASADPDLVPEDDTDPGTLRRIRDLL